MIAWAGLLVIAMLSWSWFRFPQVWNDYRSHGYVVALLCCWLLWRDRVLLQQQDRQQPWAVVVLLGLSMAWLAAYAVSVQAVHLALAPAILLVWLYVIRGNKAARYGAELLAVFTLALPVWEILTGLLQWMTVTVNGVLLRGAGISAAIEGSLIHIDAGIIEVASTCAGTNFLMAGLTLGACYAFLFVNRWQTRLKIGLAAALLSILSNWLRVFGLIVIGDATGMRSSLMHDHVLYGWVIFSAAMVVFFWLAGRMGRGSVVRVVATGEPLRESVDPPSLALVAVATAAAVAGPLLFVLLSVTQREAELDGRFPGTAIADLRGSEESSADAWTPAFAGFAKRYTASVIVEGVDVQFDRFIYRRSGQRTEMVGGANSIAPDSAVFSGSLIGPLDDGMRMAREVLLRTPDGNGRLVWYWYRVAGVATPSGMKAKLLEFWAFLGRRSSSEIMVTSAPCLRGDCRRARAVLFRVTTGHEMPVANQDGRARR